MQKIAQAWVLLAASGVLWAQPDFPQGEFQGFYQRVQGFDFNSGSPSFQVEQANLNGGGLGFVFNLSHWLGFWSQTGFYGGVEQSGIQMKLINEMQGLKLTKRGLGPLAVYAKAGMGFVRYVFEIPNGTAVRYGTSFSYGGGLDIKLSEGMSLLLEATQLSLGLPDITGSRTRDKWDSSVLVTTGIAFRF